MEMKNNTIRNLIIGISLIFSPLIHPQNLDPYKFFPAHVGDHWEYTQNGPDIIYTVIRDSVDQKDSSRFVFYNYNPSSAQYKITRDYNVIQFPQSVSPGHFYKLNAKIGESWLAVPGFWVVKLMDSSQAYVFGKQTTVKTFAFYRPAHPSDTVVTAGAYLVYWQKLAYGFGMISQEDGAYQPTLLRGCRIDGVTYGTVDVKELPNDLPSDFILYQNYPNPFNPSTTISFSIPRYSNVIIKVFDFLGREIQEIVNNYFSPGTYKVEFNERNLASGIYFYQLITGKTTRTLKMMLQK
ncbi:MAG: T9SS type A sorting domain-containing protein [Bacteroidetes bacterium]|nr:T9SS type A sorting domain-containing protein [Bacteroidota bacterium]MCL6100656.1 T9SS type A sorting domain-containing protein [Bacteroidota bacterium]